MSQNKKTRASNSTVKEALRAKGMTMNDMPSSNITARKVNVAKAITQASAKTGQPKMTYESDVLAAIHEMATDLHSAGVMKRSTMREFDELCLTPVHELGPDEIRKIREKSGVSQTVMARVVNVTVSTVGQWERGEKKPAGASLKLLTLAKEHGLESIY